MPPYEYEIKTLNNFRFVGGFLFEFFINYDIYNKKE